jgi:RNA polymerase sigma-70 factor, ECF subfamily
MRLILPAIVDLVFANDNPQGVAGRINSCMKGLVSGSAASVVPVAGQDMICSGVRRAGESVGGRGRAWMDRVVDEVLVKRVASGDERALSDLYDRYASLIYGTGMRLLGDRETAEELVQDVFTSVWKNSADFDPARARFATWLYRITRNRATDLIRRRNARVRAVGSEPLREPGEVDPSGALLRRFDVAAGLSRLSPVHRELLVLAYFRGLTQREISERTDTPLGTVKSRTTAALRALRETMGFDEDRWSTDE